MSYLKIPPQDFGLLQYGSNAYGGFAYRADTLDTLLQTVPSSSSATDPTRRFITEHNLALFWRRPGLYPRSNAFPIPLLDTHSPFDAGVRNRPPGNLRVDSSQIRYRNRNLLAGQLIEENPTAIRLWAVNDASNHRMLHEYQLQLVPDAHSCGRTKLLHIGQAEETTGGGEEDRMGMGMMLPTEALQLRAVQGVEQRVFVRTKMSLDLAKPTGNSYSPVFKHSVRAFTQVPYMDGECACIDANGMLFWGQIDQSATFARAKMTRNLLDVSPTDCPRLLLALNTDELREVDLREPHSCPGQLLFAKQALDRGTGPAQGGGDPTEQDGVWSKQTFTQISARDQLWRVSTPNVQLECVLVTTTRQHILVDRRMPGIALLTMDHAEMEGGDYALTIPAFTDPETGAQIYSHYTLTQIRKPALSHWAFAYHPKECLWSSLGPKYLMHSPRSICQFAKPACRDIGFEPTELPAHTRAFHYQPLHQDLNISSTRALLFRQMEGGELWYENIFFDPLPKLSQDAERDLVLEENATYEGSYSLKPVGSGTTFVEQCLHKIRQFLHERPNKRTHFFEGIDERLLKPIEEQKRMISIADAKLPETPLEFASNMDVDIEEMDPADPLSDVGQIQAIPPADEQLAKEDWREQFNLDDEMDAKKRIFSSMVHKMWCKTETLCVEMAAEREAGKHVLKDAALMEAASIEDDEQAGDQEEADNEIDETDQQPQTSQKSTLMSSKLEALKLDEGEALTTTTTIRSVSKKTHPVLSTRKTVREYASQFYHGKKRRRPEVDAFIEQLEAEQKQRQKQQRRELKKPKRADEADEEEMPAWMDKILEFKPGPKLERSPQKGAGKREKKRAERRREAEEQPAEQVGQEVAEDEEEQAEADEYEFDVDLD